jgi:outer membrane lipoprotein LolB
VIHLRPLFGLLVTSVLVTGCATTGVAPTPGTRVADPEVLTQWVAKGRIALVAQGEGGSGSFVWQQRSERTELSVRGPFGAGGVQVATDGESFELVDGSGQPLDGAAARAELERRLGIALPLAELRYWMLGVPAPQAGSGPVEKPAGAPAAPGFIQRGWTVSYDALGAQAGWQLPSRLTATTGSTRIRVIVDDWMLPPP